MIDPIAAGTMRLGVGQMVDRYPLLGGIVAGWHIIEDPAVETMAIGFQEPEGWTLYYAPEFVRSLPLDQLTGVLLHECRHVLYEHPFQLPEVFPDQDALVVAQETTVNEDLPLPLPSGVLRIEDFGLPKGEDTETRYGRLARKNPRKPIFLPLGSVAPDPGPTAPDTSAPHASGAKANSVAKSGACRKKGSKIPQPNSSTSGQPSSSPSDGKAENKNMSGPHGRTPDNHDRWNEALANKDAAKAQFDLEIAALHESGVRPNAYEQTVIEESIRACGNQPGHGESLLGKILTGRKIPWQRLLRRFVGKKLQRCPTLRRPPRRFPHMAGILYGRQARSKKPKIMAAVDTSGSMSDKVLAELSDELLRLSRSHDVEVVECDTVIHRHYPMKGPIKSVRGRGGTSFRPPFEKKFLNAIKPDLIIYLTDGCGDAPVKGPPIPVLWVITEGGVPPTTWGKVIYIQTGEHLGEVT